MAEILTTSFRASNISVEPVESVELGPTFGTYPRSMESQRGNGINVDTDFQG